MVQRPAEEALHHLVEILADTGDLAIQYVVAAKGLDQALHPLVGDALDAPAEAASTAPTPGHGSRALETDIEHIVARSEAHESGPCAANPATRSEFASDVLNLTLVSPQREPLQEERKRRGRVASPPERMLVRRTCRAGPAGIRPHHRLRRGGRDRESPGRVPDNQHGRAGALGLNPDCPDNTHAQHRRGLPRHAGLQRERQDHVHGIATGHHGHPAYEYMRHAEGDGTVCE